MVDDPAVGDSYLSGAHIFRYPSEPANEINQALPFQIHISRVLAAGAICVRRWWWWCGGGAAPAGCVSTATVVCTQSGQLQGMVEGSYRAFRGIPFAAPPVGDLRWRPPAAPASWQGLRSATAFGNRCPQIDLSGALVGNEDCLTLNVYAVNPPASSKQPVMVYFHGGGERTGSAQDPPWNAVPPLAGHGVIVVTVRNTASACSAC